MLKYIEIKGYKSVREQTISFGRINVLIGANGSGKSNLISFFRMLGFLITGNLQVFVGRSGGAETFLHYGSKNTDRTESTMLFERDAESYKHYMCLRYGARDTFVFSEERISSQNGSGSETSVSFGPGHRESGLADIPNNNRSG